MSISSDSEFKTALNGLSIPQQRVVAARFVENVATLTNDSRVKAAINAAKRADITGPERDVVYQAAKTASVESFTQCGKEADWIDQAGHFVAKAAMACLAPGEKGSLAWDVAMEARMARTCETIAKGLGTEHREAEQQYRILADFMNS